MVETNGFMLGTLLALNSPMCWQAVSVLAVRAAKPVVGCLSLRLVPPCFVLFLHFLSFPLPLCSLGCREERSDKPIFSELIITHATPSRNISKYVHKEDILYKKVTISQRVLHCQCHVYVPVCCCVLVTKSCLTLL